jgi:putative ABC transport system substrate-binding protein
MNRKLFWVVLFLFLGAGTFVETQQAKKIPRIGFLMGTSLSANTARIDAFQQGLREFGYVEGKNIVIQWRSAEGKRDRPPSLAVELVRLKVDSQSLFRKPIDPAALIAAVRRLLPRKSLTARQILCTR